MASCSFQSQSLARCAPKHPCMCTVLTKTVVELSYILHLIQTPVQPIAAFPLNPISLLCASLVIHSHLYKPYHPPGIHDVLLSRCFNSGNAELRVICSVHLPSLNPCICPVYQPQVKQILCMSPSPTSAPLKRYCSHDTALNMCCAANLLTAMQSQGSAKNKYSVGRLEKLTSPQHTLLPCPHHRETEPPRPHL